MEATNRTRQIAARIVSIGEIAYVHGAHALNPQIGRTLIRLGQEMWRLAEKDETKEK